MDKERKEMFTEECKKEFIDSFAIVAKQATHFTVTDQQIQASAQLSWVRTLLSSAIDYNVPGGKHLRGLLVFHTFQLLGNTSNKEEYEKNLHRAKVLGWCVEFMQAYALIVDDIMDQSLERRGRQCHYLNPEVGVAGAICNASLIYEAIYSMIFENFEHNPSLSFKLTEEFHRMARTTWIGQSLDTRLHFKRNPEKFSFETYRTIAEQKTAYYSFYFPILAAMLLANFDADVLDKEGGPILIKIGQLFQIQDDYLDCYGDVKKTKKIGTDIEDGKCTWLLVCALEISDNEQLKTIQENIGKWDQNAVEEVKKIYAQLNLAEKFKHFEEDEFKAISKEIQKILHPNFRQLLLSILQSIYKRES